MTTVRAHVCARVKGGLKAQSCRSEKEISSVGVWEKILVLPSTRPLARMDLRTVLTLNAIGWRVQSRPDRIPSQEFKTNLEVRNSGECNPQKRAKTARLCSLPYMFIKHAVTLKLFK